MIIVVGYSAALGLRGLDAPVVAEHFRAAFATLLPAIVLTHILLNLLFGVYGHEWEYASIEEARRLIASATSTVLILLLGIFTYQEITQSPTRALPIGVIVLGSVFTLGGMGVTRFRSRMFSFRKTAATQMISTVIVGTGKAAAELARNADRGEQPIDVLGFVSVVEGPQLKRIANHPVLGSLSEIYSVVHRLRVEQILVAERLDHATIRDLVDMFLEVDVRLTIAPRIDDVLAPDNGVHDVRDIAVSDLLPRPVVDTNLAIVSDLLTNRRVLVTGAGGSIGSELVSQIGLFAPSLIVALDNDETHLYDGTARWSQNDTNATTVLCDVKDERRLMHVFSEFKPEVVFHAAAHKHVPILERYPAEAVTTNVVGTSNVLLACHRYDVDQFVLVSTDKAVEPTSVMGASKRVAEMLTQAASTRWGTSTTFTAVRFGNVLGSRGSVVPTFMRQIKNGGPVTVTDPDMLRYFMTIDEAVQLVLQASTLAEGGEVFVLDMGEPVRIGDLAHRMIRLAGLIPGRDIDVRITGRRPGEKLSETLAIGLLEASPLNRVNVTRPEHPGLVTLGEIIDQFDVLAEHGSNDELKEFLLAVANQRWYSDEVITLNPIATDSIPEAGFGVVT